MTRNSIVFDNVSYNFGEKEIFRELSFEVPAGQTVGIMGPSGTGKTTLLRLIGGQIQPDNGNDPCRGQGLKEDQENRIIRTPQRFGNVVSKWGIIFGPNGF